jgi:hypothetical protein
MGSNPVPSEQLLELVEGAMKGDILPALKHLPKPRPYSPQIPEGWLTRPQAAARLGVGLRTLDLSRRQALQPGWWAEGWREAGGLGARAQRPASGWEDTRRYQRPASRIRREEARVPNLSLKGRLLQSLASYERDLQDAHLRAERRRRAAWLRLAELRAEQAQLDLEIAHLRRDRCQPPPPPAPVVTFERETVPAPAPNQPPPSTGPAPAAQPEARRLKEEVSGGARSPALAIWERLGEEPDRPAAFEQLTQSVHLPAYSGSGSGKDQR